MAANCGATKRRWIIERTNAWLGPFRRLLVRHDHLLSIYRAFYHLQRLNRVSDDSIPVHVEHLPIHGAVCRICSGLAPNLTLRKLAQCRVFRLFNPLENAYRSSRWREPGTLSAWAALTNQRSPQERHRIG